MTEKNKKPMSRRRAIVYFILCVFFEQVGNIILTYTEGFTVLLPSIACVIAYFITFFFFGKALVVLDLGPAYAIWGGVSVVVVAIATVTILGGKLSAIDIVGLVLIVAGVIGMDLWGVKGAPEKEE